MDSPRDCHMSEVSQTEKNYLMILLICRIFLNDQINVFTKQKDSKT